MRSKNLKIELPKGERYKYQTAEMMPNLCTQLLCCGAKGMGKTISIVNLVNDTGFELSSNFEKFIKTLNKS